MNKEDLITMLEECLEELRREDDGPNLTLVETYICEVVDRLNDEE